MRYLFIVQGEGRGHLTQAMTLEKLLIENGHEVVEILVGQSKSRKPAAFFEKGVDAPVHYFESFNFVPSANNKKPSILKTTLYNIFNVTRYFSSLKFIKNHIRQVRPDVILNFYEMLGTFGFLLSRTKAKQICIGHQYLFLHKDFHLPRHGYEGAVALNIFTKMTALKASKLLALSFRDMPNDDSKKLKVVPPLLRNSVLDKYGNTEKGDYILGYMLNTGFADEVMKWHNEHPDVKLHFFWDNKDAGPIKKVDETLTFYYINDVEFLNQMAGCKAYASTAGFESICEAMYMGKPLLMVPSHIEQQCNAFDATQFDAAVSSDVFNMKILLDFAETKFKPDLSFPEWARGARATILKEVEKI